MFKLHSEFKPSGDQPKAISTLVDRLNADENDLTLLGVTGSGKTFTLANVITSFERPVLVISHNKTLAAQLFSEFKGFFPENAVEFFISYYDYYLPEAYIPQTDTYIAKDASINETIERLRLSTTTSLLERRDVIVVASVSCIYNLGSPEDYESMCVKLRVGDIIGRDDFLKSLVDIQFERNDMAPEAGQFRVRGDSIDVFIPQREEFIRIDFWGDEIEKLFRFNSVSGKQTGEMSQAMFFPCKHFVMPGERIEPAIDKIMRECDERVRFFEQQGLLVEAQRLYQRTMYDMEMLREIGYCNGIENYSLHLSGRAPGSRPMCLIDFFPKDFITIIDESHMTIPQLNAMAKADRSRKQTLVDHGFRLPSALENRPLRFEEFNEITGTKIYVSATPAEYEIELSGQPVEQLVRPTGLLDPEVIIRPLDNQVDDIISEIRKCVDLNERVLVTTLTKKSAERLADYLNDIGLSVKYLHSEIDAIKRVKILKELRGGEFDCLIGINLLREGIDLPEVALVAILDADKEGFLRSEKALIQVAGRAARNINGRVILYADRITDSVQKLVKVTTQRRKKQQKYNKTHHVSPQTVTRTARESISDIIMTRDSNNKQEEYISLDELDDHDVKDIIKSLEDEMMKAAAALEFERAAALRDKIRQLH